MLQYIMYKNLFCWTYHFSTCVILFTYYMADHFIEQLSIYILQKSFLLPSTQFVEKNTIFLVSRGLSCENSDVRGCGSDSPVSEELST